uniref:Uncharacterized protein n=1 Tax=Octactis speculum TaxID=3111310 RepID=A0A7S2AT79_9STRA|mmetsp:Transcript_1522/g.1861  ORF Transcript_1522/g.1861 Transcript_1522/m.1861 type:complete len:211 (+) Transcript_1522:19-651(+)
MKVLLLLSCSLLHINAFHLMKSLPRYTDSRLLASLDDQNSVNRRVFAGATLPLSLAILSFGGQPAHARGGPASPAELARLRKGLDGLDYFLENFDKETTVCKPECARNPDAIRVYLGLRSTTHPLYQAEKILVKAQDNLDDDEDPEAFISATEAWNGAVAESNSLAYTSSFGEYNPGGGKDAVEKYLQSSRLEVVKARDALRGICKVLKV